MRHFLEITDFSSEELEEMLNRADHLYKCWKSNNMPQILNNHRAALWSLGNGFRNRMAFEIGIRAMGGDVSFVPGNLGVHEPIEDIGHYLKNWFTILIIRASKHSDVISVSRDVNIPVINARTDYNHPCEIIGDLQFIRRKRGSIKDLNLVFVGEVTNICMSWFKAAIRFPISVTQVAPPEYLIKSKELSEINENAIGEIKISDNPETSINKETDVVYTDCWPRDEHKEKIKKLFLQYQITSKTLDKMNKNGFFLPCPPVTRGQEVSEDSMHSKLCMDYAAKEFLLHSQNAIIEFLIKHS